MSAYIILINKYISALLKIFYNIGINAYFEF